MVITNRRTADGSLFLITAETLAGQAISKHSEKLRTLLNGRGTPEHPYAVSQSGSALRTDGQMKRPSRRLIRFTKSSRGLGRLPLPTSFDGPFALYLLHTSPEEKDRNRRFVNPGQTFRQDIRSAAAQFHRTQVSSAYPRLLCGLCECQAQGVPGCFGPADRFRCR